MANMTEVQMAFKQGDKAKTAQLLKTLLHENPSADAWVMAARLTSNPETAKMHLQRALAFEPKHIKARDMLRDLGGTPMTTSSAFTGGLLPAIRAELEKFGANKPILKKLSPSQRMITAISLYMIVIAFMLAAIGSLLSGPEAITLPATTYIPVFQSDTLVNQWTTEGLNLTKVENAPETPKEFAKETLNLMVADDAGSHEITVFLYETVAKIVDDRQHLKILAEDPKIKLDILQTAVIIYPADLSEATASLLKGAFNPAPTDSA
ncbi:MAG: hypothetical protein ABI970_07660 [Chloroflexota bacterium]